jgi:hypothetical protein
MDALLDHAFTLNDNVEVSKFTCLVQNAATYPDGCSVPAGANALKFAGVAQESILPNGMSDYAGGLYPIVSGTAWPAGAIPTSAIGRKLSVRMAGITRVVAAGVIAQGDRLNIADAQGRVKKINEAATTVVQECGFALTAAGQAGDIIRMFITNIVRIV